MRLTFITAAFLLVSQGALADYLQPRQGFFNSILSIFDPNNTDDGPSSKPTPAPKASKTQSSQATTTQKVNPTTPTHSSPTSTSPSSTTPSSTSTDTSTDTTTDTTTDSSTITSSASLTTTTSTTPTAVPINPRPSQTPAQSGGIPAAGIAVAVIFSIIILLIIAWITFRYHPKCRAWWAARQEEKYKQRSYRDALDGPDAAGGGGLTRGRAGLQSFFHPKGTRTQGTGMGSIKRKTIHWGAPSPKEGGVDIENPMPQQTRGLNHNAYSGQHGFGAAYNNNNNNFTSGEKVPLAELASPMGIDRQPSHQQQYEGNSISRPTASHSPSMSPISPVSNNRTGQNHGTQIKSLNSSISSPMHGPVTHQPNRESKALPQVRVNGQVIYELGA